MAIRTIMVDRKVTAELPNIIPIVQHILLCIVGAKHHTPIGTSPRLLMLTSDDIDHTTHCIRTIQQRSWTTDHLYPLHVGGYIRIRQGMTEHASPLRLTIK